MDSLGTVARKHQDWFDENDKEIQGRLEEKHQKHKTYLSDTSSVSNKAAYSNICKAVQTRWAEHFDSILKRPSSINDDAINRLPQVECNLLLDKFQTVAETVKAIKLLSSGKAPGSDAILQLQR